MLCCDKIKTRKLTKLLKKLIKPAYSWCDNGSEFISYTLGKFAEENGIEIRFSESGKPTQNRVMINIGI